MAQAALLSMLAYGSACTFDYDAFNVRAGIGGGSSTGASGGLGSGASTSVGASGSGAAGGGESGAGGMGGMGVGGDGGSGGGPVLDDCGGPGIVACYRFDGTGDDQSGNGHHLALTSVTFQSGKLGDAGVFGGASVAQAVYDPMFDLDSWTLEAWVSPSSIPTGDNRAGIVDDGANYSLFLYEDGIRCETGGAELWTSALATNVWVHVACTYHQGSMRLFLDGEPVDQAGGVPLPGNPPGYPLAVGGDSPSGAPFTGMIDMVRVWSGPLSARQICSSAGQSDCDD